MTRALRITARLILTVAVTLGAIEVVQLLTGAGQRSAVLVVLALVAVGSALEAWSRP